MIRSRSSIACRYSSRLKLGSSSFWNEEKNVSISLLSGRKRTTNEPLDRRNEFERGAAEKMRNICFCFVSENSNLVSIIFEIVELLFLLLDEILKERTKWKNPIDLCLFFYSIVLKDHRHSKQIEGKRIICSYRYSSFVIELQTLKNTFSFRLLLLILLDFRTILLDLSSSSF